jgi:hypothetical protein
MPWLFHRSHEDAGTTDDEQASDERPDALREALGGLVRFINSSAGRLPVAAVVRARDITDTIGAMIDASGERELDVYTLISVKGIVQDYLPTTLRSYLALDDATTAVPRSSGRTPEASLAEQLDSMASAATKVLTAAQRQDADALYTQGNFLRTKFSGSDLDL